MNQRMWLRTIATSLMGSCPFNRGIVRLWARCEINDDMDALGCIIMGGEL